MTYADLIFAPFCDALVSGLASRTHQWRQWEILQHYEALVGEKVQIVDRCIELRIQTVQSDQILHLKGSWRQSPSLLLAQALDSTAAPQKNSFSPLMGVLQNSSLEVLAPIPFRAPLHDLDEELPESSRFGPENLVLDASDPLKDIQTASDIRYRNNSGKSFHRLIY